MESEPLDQLAYDPGPGPSNIAQQWNGGGTSGGWMPSTTIPYTPPMTLQPGLELRCAWGAHRFACKHETRCFCGETIRASVVAVPEGL